QKRKRDGWRPLNSRSHRRRSSKAQGSARPRFRRFHLAFARRRVRHKRVEEFSGGIGYSLDSVIERGFVGIGWLVEAAEFSYKLNCRSANLFFGGGWFEVMQRFDIATHFSLLTISITAVST